jgi:hypothetical protein
MKWLTKQEIFYAIVLMLALAGFGYFLLTETNPIFLPTSDQLVADHKARFAVLVVTSFMVIIMLAGYVLFKDNREDGWEFFVVRILGIMLFALQADILNVFTDSSILYSVFSAFVFLWVLFYLLDYDQEEEIIFNFILVGFFTVLAFIGFTYLYIRCFGKFRTEIIIGLSVTVLALYLYNIKDRMKEKDLQFSLNKIWFLTVCILLISSLTAYAAVKYSSRKSSGEISKEYVYYKFSTKKNYSKTVSRLEYEKNKKTYHLNDISTNLSLL